MAEQVRAERGRATTNNEYSEPVSEEIPQSDADKLKAELDAIIDDIDGELMENAEAMVKNYHQLGGQ